MKRGRFITLEGPEGGGKSTQIRRIAEMLRAEGREVVTAREPGGTPTGEAIRGLLQYDHSGESPSPACEVLLFIASRAQLVDTVIRPALKRGAVVLCDRFADSTLAYQGYGRGFDVAALRRLNEFAIADCVPDVTLVLDLPVDAGRARMAGRHAAGGDGPDRLEREAAEFHARVRDGYLALARAEPGRFRVMDASRAEEDVFEALAVEVRRVLEG
ncbi:MAG: dTMP kinase [Kiritimatiellae bacterium]|nr:dTMP kinase [Kiritimatiellia bacterium]